MRWQLLLHEETVNTLGAAGVKAALDRMQHSGELKPPARIVLAVCGLAAWSEAKKKAFATTLLTGYAAGTALVRYHAPVVAIHGETGRKHLDGEAYIYRLDDSGNLLLPVRKERAGKLPLSDVAASGSARGNQAPLYPLGNSGSRAQDPPGKSDFDAFSDALKVTSIRQLPPKKYHYFSTLVQDIIEGYDRQRTQHSVARKPECVTVILGEDAFTLEEKKSVQRGQIDTTLSWQGEEKFIAAMTLATLTARLQIDRWRHTASYGLPSDSKSLKNLRRKIDWRNADLTAVDLSYEDLTAAKLAAVNFHQANLSYAILREAVLKDAILTGTNLSEAVFRDANLSGAILTGANAFAAYFSNTNLTNARLSDTNLQGTDFSNALLSGAHLNNADLRQAHLTQAHLDGAILINADLSEADLTDADVSGAWLVNVNLTNVKLRGANFRNAHFRNAIISADLTGADFTGSDLSEARVTLHLPAVWNEFSLDLYLNHAANGRSAITSINSIDARFTELKVTLMRQLLTGMDRPELNLQPFTDSLLDCIQPEYMSDKRIAHFMEKSVILPRVKQASERPWQTGNVALCQSLMRWVQGKTPADFEKFVLKKNGFFIQLINNSRRAGDDAVRQQAGALYGRYLNLERIRTYTGRDYDFGNDEGAPDWQDKRVSNYGTVNKLI